MREFTQNINFLSLTYNLNLVHFSCQTHNFSFSSAFDLAFIVLRPNIHLQSGKIWVIFLVHKAFSSNSELSSSINRTSSRRNIRYFKFQLIFVFESFSNPVYFDHESVRAHRSTVNLTFKISVSPSRILYMTYFVS